MASDPHPPPIATEGTKVRPPGTWKTCVVRGCCTFVRGGERMEGATLVGSWRQQVKILGFSDFSVFG
ncbi:hypothetical protein V6Z11_D11G280600 [Gossypium hirsutum]